MVAILLLFTLVVSIDKASAQGAAVVSVTRSRDGDVYLMLYANGLCEERRCSAILPTVEPGGDCVSDSTLRSQYCPSNGSGQSFLSRGNNVETLAVIGSDGILKVFDTHTGDFEISRIANKNPRNNRTENQLETIGCNVTSVAVIRGNGSVITSINSTVFKIVLDSMNERGIHIQVDEANLSHSREEYDGEIYRITTSCHSNINIDCVVFKLNGTAHFTQVSTLKTPFTVTKETFTRITSFWEDPINQYIMIGSGCGIAVLICIISVFSICICTLLVLKKKKTATIHARRIELRYNATQEASKSGIIDMKLNSSYAGIEIQGHSTQRKS